MKFTSKLTPAAFFMCTGLGGSGCLHGHTNVGGTQEQLKSWPELFRVRKQARDHSIPEKTRQDWKALFQQITEAERGFRKQELLARRKEILRGDKPVNGPIGPIYDCAQHKGLAFRPDDDDAALVPMACCYVCKLAMLYDEPYKGSNDPRFELTRLLGNFSLVGRGKNPTSCAEVMCHLRCRASVST